MITHISDTARWVAYYRAMETARPDAIFRDPFAERLAGPEGRAIVDTLKNGRRMAWAMIVRTSSIDDLVMDAVRGKGVDLVVNLAAGLDARPWRMDLPPTLRWVDVDLPGILDHKLQVIADAKPRCSYEAIRVDLTDVARRKAVLAQLGASSANALVISEGLLLYLTAEEVGGLAQDLRAGSGFKWWISDIAHPRLLKRMQDMWGKDVNQGNAPFKFAPAEGTKFFERFGWREADFISSLEEAHRIKREMAMTWFWGRVFSILPGNARENMRRMAGVVLLERA